MKTLSKLKVIFDADEALNLIASVHNFIDKQKLSVSIEQGSGFMYVIAYGFKLPQEAWIKVSETSLELSRYVPSAIRKLESFCEEDEDMATAFYEVTRALMTFLESEGFELYEVSYSLFDEFGEFFTYPCGKSGSDATDGLQDQADGWRMITIYDLDD